MGERWRGRKSRAAMKLHNSHNFSIETLLELVQVRLSVGLKRLIAPLTSEPIAKQNFNAATSDFKMSYPF
jgi:hypothetical protein